MVEGLTSAGSSRARVREMGKELSHFSKTDITNDQYNFFFFLQLFSSKMIFLS